jgi:AraC-like DNA-binding protein
MIYLERSPSPPLAGFIRTLWYTRAPGQPHRRERVLPNGCMQVVITLAADALTDCDENSAAGCRPIPPAILVGARGRYEVIHTRDFAELVGVIFRPGGLGPWLRLSADDFFERTASLDSVWQFRDLRAQLCEQPTPTAKLARLDALLCASLSGRSVAQRPVVRGALAELRHNSVHSTALSLGISERRLHQLFCEDVGLSPKLWSRIRRFQSALSCLHSGQDIHWDELSLACGYYDQSHFSNDFQSFSGINPTTYSERRGRWRNHVAME